MKTIEYCVDGEAIPDARCYERASKFLENEEGDLEVLMKTSTENLILMIRAHIAEGFSSHEGIRFLYKGEYIYPNHQGRLPRRPAGFCDTAENALMRCLRACSK
jgi:hypothetical protein